MLIDSHSHLHFPAYQNDLEAILGRMREKNVVTLTVGTSIKSSEEAIAFSREHQIPCSVGFHPSHARPAGVSGFLDPTEEVYDETFDIGTFRRLLLRNREEHNSPPPSLSLREGDDNSPPRKGCEGDKGGGMIAAIGECGLDYFRLPEDEGLKKQFKQKQQEAFEAQITLATEFSLPLIIHTRASKENSDDAYRDTYEIISNVQFSITKVGVMHCFLGSKEWAKKFLNKGFFISFSGIVTFKKADRIREVAAFVPRDLILTETDCPYLTPEPHRGKQNEPSYVEYVLRKLEEIRGESLEDRIVENFEKVFHREVKS